MALLDALSASGGADGWIDGWGKGGGICDGGYLRAEGVRRCLNKGRKEESYVYAGWIREVDSGGVFDVDSRVRIDGP